MIAIERTHIAVAVAAVAAGWLAGQLIVRFWRRK
jgi:hypothetical protein